MKKAMLSLYLFAFVLQLNLPAQSMKIMSYNIRLDLTQDAENQWEKRKESMIDLLFHYQPGIIGIQEALYHQVQYLDSSLVSYNYVGVGRDDGKNKGEFSAIFFDTTLFSVKMQSTFWLSERSDSVSKGWDAAYIRICTYGLFLHKPSGQKFWVFNTHFDNKGELARENSAKLILQKILMVNNDHYPLILTGDFNSYPESKPVQILTKTLGDAWALSKVKPYGPEGTFTGFDPDQPIRERIDYIFVKDMDVLSYLHIDDRRKDNYFVSDHLPVMASLEFHASKVSEGE